MLDVNGLITTLDMNHRMGRFALWKGLSFFLALKETGLLVQRRCLNVTGYSIPRPKM